MNWLYVGIGIAIFIASLIWEVTREFYEEIWEHILEGIQYFFSFEWISDVWEFITGMFDNLSEFSVGGLAFGFFTFLFVYALRKYMLNPFLVHMGGFEAIFWGGATYVGSVIGGYLVGKKLFDE